MRKCNAESQKKFSKRFQVKRRRQGFAHLEVITLWFQHLCMSQNVFEDFFDNLSNFTEFVIKNEKLLKNKSLYSQKFVIKNIFVAAFLKRVCAGPHPEMYEDW